MLLAATVFLEFWKRKQAELKYDWDVADFELEEVTVTPPSPSFLFRLSLVVMTSSLFQHIRPDFEVRCKKWKVNPVTKMKEPHLPSTHKIARKASSLTVVFFMVSTCLIYYNLISGS